MLVYMEPAALLLFAASLLGAGGLQITHLNVPTEVRNDTTHVVLDCVYTFKPEEAKLGLVVKWYFNNGPSPVYQWIPGQRPQDLGALKGKLNLGYRATDHDFTMFRALYIVRPTTELSGDYKCLVSTFEEEDFMTKRMIVIAHGNNFELNRRKPDSESVIITCRAENLYPEPKMSIYKNSDVELTMPDVHVDTIAKTGAYDITATAHLKDAGLDSPTFFDCELKIPEVRYATRKTMIYYPAGSSTPITTVSSANVATLPSSSSESGASSAQPSTLATLLLCAGAALLLRWPTHWTVPLPSAAARAC